MAKLNLTDEQRKQRSEHMKRVRQQYYESLTPEQQFAYRSKGGKSAVNRNKFTSETSKKALESRWGSRDEV